MTGKGRKSMRRWLLSVLLLGIGPAVCPAQTFVYDVDDLGFFDNRETSTPYQRSQTLFGNRLGATVGITDGQSSLMAGSYVVQEFGRTGLADVGCSFYYRYQGPRFSGAFGSFPRRLLRHELPDLFLDDSLRYYVPNLQGALIQYNGHYGSADLYCNWRGRQSYTEREVFELVSMGEWHLPAGPCLALLGYDVELTHFSVRRGQTSDKVYDKLMAHPFVGIQAAPEVLLLDSLRLTLGPVASFNRDRTDKVWKTPLGVYSDLCFDKSFLSLRNRLYVGEVQLTDYELYGRALHQGDAWYRSPSYDRLDVSFRLLRRANVECRVTASFHFTEGAVDNSQTVLVRALF